jgi:hypothetical protein
MKTETQSLTVFAPADKRGKAEGVKRCSAETDFKFEISSGVSRTA